MKKKVFTIVTFVCLIALLVHPICVSAEEDTSHAEEIYTVEVEHQDVSDTVSECTEVTEETESESFWQSAFDYFKENYSGISVALFALYAAFPKYGGIAGILHVLKGVKNYFDDKNNDKSIYNVISGSADSITKFMNEVYPVMLAIAQSKETEKEFISNLQTFSEQFANNQNVLKMLCERDAFLTQTFNELISISPYISAKRKAELEQKFADGEKVMRSVLAEATKNDGKEKKQNP